MFAGLWDAWRNRDRLIVTCAIITTPANDLVADLHDRMPAILPPESHEAWLNPSTTRVDLLKMLTPFPASLMKTYPVSSKVNAPENDTADLLEHVDVEVGQTFSLF
jgi:putative SOS response-associated peptidase YedK